MADTTISPNAKTLRRRAFELADAADACADPDSTALLLFYAAECGLQALYMTTYGLRDTNDSNAAAVASRSFNHALERLVSALKIQPSDVPKPSSMKLRNGSGVQVHHLHQAWRYGEKVEAQADIVTWLRSIITYVRGKL